MALTEIPIELSSTPSIVDGGNATAITIDSSENVGIGTSSPISISGYTALNVGAGSIGSFIQIDGATAGHYHRIVNNNGQLYIQADQGNSTASSAIVFNVDSTERMRILPTGGITFNGDTAAANALEDYEEGTFTPTIVAATGNQPTITYTTNTGTYTKVGKLVTLVGIVQIATISGTTSGNLNITGLPFTQISGDGNAACGTFSPNGMNFARTEFGSVSQYQTPTLGFLTQNNNSGWSWEQVNILSAGDSFRFSISYLTTA